jgi:hypothetical protein
MVAKQTCESGSKRFRLLKGQFLKYQQSAATNLLRPRGLLRCLLTFTLIDNALATIAAFPKRQTSYHIFYVEQKFSLQIKGDFGCELWSGSGSGGPCLIRRFDTDKELPHSLSTILFYAHT